MYPHCNVKQNLSLKAMETGKPFLKVSASLGKPTAILSEVCREDRLSHNVVKWAKGIKTAGYVEDIFVEGTQR